MFDHIAIHFAPFEQNNLSTFNIFAPCNLLIPLRLVQLIFPLSFSALTQQHLHQPGKATIPATIMLQAKTPKKEVNSYTIASYEMNRPGRVYRTI